MAPLRAAVIGAGNMGRHHVRLLERMPGVDLVAVVDSDTALAESRAGAIAASALNSIDDLPDVDFAVVATPTSDHFSTAQAVLRRRIDVLVEKPLAGTPEEAKELVEIASENEAVLSVGHVERFNPAIRVVAGMTSAPVMMSFERLSPYSPRVSESVVFDLMVHDLDLACWFADASPTRIEAVGRSVFSDELDVATAVLQFENGCIAAVQASRATQDKVRRISVAERDHFIVADSVRQDVSIKREAEVEFDEGGSGLYRQASVVEVPYLDRSGEPLARELEDVISAIRERRRPLVDGETGLRAVVLASRVEKLCRESAASS